MSKKAVVLLSGGLDSATVLYLAKKKFRCHAMVFDYGQRHKKEINSAVKIARKAKVKIVKVEIKLPHKESALLGKKKKLPRRKESSIFQSGIPSTYVPARNTIFLSYALSYAEAIKAEAIFIGANALDYSGYPDCRGEYFRSFNNLIKNGLRDKKINIKTPLLNLTKAQIVQKAKELKVPLELTWSCYRGGKEPCGVCDSCILRKKGFKEAGIKT